MQSSAVKLFLKYVVRGSRTWLPLFCILYCSKLQAQVKEVELQNNRLLVADKLTTAKRTNSALLIKYLPIFSIQKVTISSISSSNEHAQLQRSFTLTDGSWGTVEYGTHAWYKNQKYWLSDSVWWHQYPGDILQAVRDTASPNCFYLAKARYTSPSRNSPILYNYLQLDHVCIEADGTITSQQLDKKYFGYFKLEKSPGVGEFPGWLARSNDGKAYYTHIINRGGTEIGYTGSDTSIHAYKIDKTGLTEAGKYYISSLNGIKYYSISANSKRLALTNLWPFGDSVSYEEFKKKREIYLYRMNDGYQLNLAPDTIRPYTYDTSQYSGLEFENAQLSPTGRYLYVIEHARSKSATPVEFPPYDPTVWYAFSARLLQVDLAGAGKPGFKPKVRILKEWQQQNYSYRIFLHSVPVDGKLYFCEEDTRYVNYNRIDTTAIKFWQLSNIETDTVTFKSARVVIDKMDFPVVYYDTETFDQNTWKQYPYQAYNDTPCIGKTSLWLHSTISYDSVIWHVNNSKFTTTPKDSLLKTALLSGRQTITYYVYRNGYEDLLMKELTVKPEGKNYADLRILPKIVYGCKENEIWLKPGTDTMTISYNWADGTAGTDRKVTDAGKYVWRVYYKNSPCPRLDTVEVKLTDWSKIALTGAANCDTTVAYVSVINLEPQMHWQWQNGDSMYVTSIVKQPGKYCILVKDILANCNKLFCTEVEFYHSKAPAWSGKDTLLCEGDKLEIKPDSGYILQCAEGTTSLNRNCIISKPGDYTFKYKKLTQQPDICSWKSAELHVKNPPAGSDLCPQVTNCQWYIPNAFSPNTDQLNEQWFPT
ncbi:MAG: hypothetical protein EOP47_16090 [Sphingobacteriaceae bacterium]|nr:MAG: hypothetical protein EOP47_16090 [Sphingobacteriaceae bacterium]